MHLLRRAVWCLLGRVNLSSATLSSAASNVIDIALASLGSGVASNVIEIDVVFPRNGTYRPSKRFPIILAVYNGALAKNIDLTLLSHLWKGPGFSEYYILGSPRIDIKDVSTKAEASGDTPYLIQGYADIDIEGQVGFQTSLYWAQCNEDLGAPTTYHWGVPNHHDQPGVRNSTMIGMDVVFTLADDAPELDLVAATADERACLAQREPQPGFSIALTGQTREHSFFYDGVQKLSPGTCEVRPDVSTTGEMVEYENETYVLSTPSPTAKPCRVRLNSAAVTSLATKASSEAAALKARCRAAASQPYEWNCPNPYEESGAVQPLAVAMVASLMVAVGAAGFLLV